MKEEKQKEEQEEGGRSEAGGEGEKTPCLRSEG